MRYVLFGKLNTESITNNERVTKSKDKLNELGIELEAVHYTQGTVDFVDIVSTDDPNAMLTFSAWYAHQGYGTITTLPSFTPDEFNNAVGRI